MSQRGAMSIKVGVEPVVREVVDFAPQRGETSRGRRFVHGTLFHHGFGSGAEIADELVYAQVSGNAGAPQVFFCGRVASNLQLVLPLLKKSAFPTLKKVTLRLKKTREE